jgi:hypothetical protein
MVYLLNPLITDRHPVGILVHISPHIDPPISVQADPGISVYIDPPISFDVDPPVSV